MTALPSGEQHVIRHGDQELAVTEIGATLREYRAGDVHVLDGFGENEACSAARGQHLIPWPNRIGDGRYTFDGEEQELALTEPPRGNAIHGLVRWASWSLVERSADRLVMGHRLHHQPGYPFILDLRITLALDDRGLTVTTSARNVGATRAPYGCGAHPYLRIGEGSIDDLSVRVPAATELLTDERMLPTGRAPVDGGDHDLRASRSLAGLSLDTAFTDLERDAGGLARVVLRGQRGELALWMDAAYPWLMLFTGDGLGPPHHRAGLGVEPMTCPPDAFRSGTGLVTLEPGEEQSARWGIDTSGVRR